MKNASLNELWLFGYGSLMWRPDFAYVAKLHGYIEGYARRFWQGSTDHRGIPGAPGRVVTLVAESTARCFGTAYHVADDAQASVLSRLDVREQGGYERRQLTVHTSTRGVTIRALVYIAGPDNPNYLGPAPVRSIAQQIAACRGPSGHNREYLERLAASLRQIGAEDAHVSELERELAQVGGG